MQLVYRDHSAMRLYGSSIIPRSIKCLSVLLTQAVDDINDNVDELHGIDYELIMRRYLV